eukprot:TRINITY_DN5269_c0_g1_i1.p1 TRINITY_DN5269_c0_g1~~TRINITY_DN5269_c0_g1_i1.p1  ORF type:complete len:602 (+),score=170.55 TRINITY_DN5269_c0_g1_i1:85-1890(+)
MPNAGKDLPPLRCVPLVQPRVGSGVQPPSSPSNEAEGGCRGSGQDPHSPLPTTHCANVSFAGYAPHSSPRSVAVRGGSPRSSPPRGRGSSARAARLYSQHTIASAAASVRSTVYRGGDTYLGDDAASACPRRDRSSCSAADFEGEPGACGRAAHWGRVAVSGALLVFCFVFTAAAVFCDATTMWGGVPPLVSFLLVLALLFELAVLEGSQVPLIHLARREEVSSLSATHPRAHHACELCHGEGRLEKYLLGREFLKLVVYFMLAKVTKMDGSGEPLGLPQAFIDVGGTGLVAAHFIVILGQLVTQLAAKDSVAAFLNLRVILPLAVYPSLGVELTGIVHAGYVVKGAVDCAVGQPSSSGLSRCRRMLWYFQCAVSFGVWIYGIAVVCYLLQHGYDSGPFGVKGAPAIALFFVLWFVLAYLDGLQVAANAASTIEPSFLSDRAASNVKLITENNGLQSYFIGKQLLSAVVRFVLITMSTSNGDARSGHVLGLGGSAQEILLETGLLGAVVLVVAPSSARLLAATFAPAYLGVPVLTWLHIRACFVIDTIGLVHCAWPLSKLLSKLVGRDDDVQEEQLPMLREPRKTPLVSMVPSAGASDIAV